jgi:hypothetical protein
MDWYPVAQLLYDLSRGKVDPEQVTSLPSALIAEYGLDPEAVRALRDRDVRALADSGLPPLLLMQWALAQGIDLAGWFRDQGAKEPGLGEDAGGRF